MFSNLNRFNVEGLDVDCDERYIAFRFNQRFLRVPFYDINQVSIFEKRVSIQYKKSMNAIYRASEEEIRKKHKELERAGLIIRNAS